ncbi:MAG: hypothetical protein IT290_10585, partial [Deltaproteobacteria bacterium]|nr:hypothetical protein [Deltaproteobacteria bacterium]
MERISSRIAYVATALCFALITAATPRVTLAEPELPVLLARANQSKVMLLIDDTGSMQAGMVHPGYDVNDPLNADTTYRMPMFIFRVNSGAAAASTSHTVTPILLALQRGYYDNRSSTAGTLWDTTKTLSQISTHKAISLLKKSGTTSGINSTRLFRLPTNPAITGSTVFNVTNVATFGGVPIRDAAQNEFFFFDVDCTGTATYVDAMCSTSYPEDFAHTFPRFDAFGAIVQNKKQRFYGSMGGTIYFEGKTIPLARGFYEEKYLRWLLYFATPAQLTELPQETRIEATRRIVRTLIQNNPTIAFGIASFNGTRWTNTVTNYDVVDMIRHPLGDHTAGYYPVIRANIGSDQATLLNVVNQIGASNGTPPHAAFVEVMRYFDARGANRYKYFGKDRYSGVDYASSPITSECDAHFVVMLTDGIPMDDCRNRFDRGAGEANIPDIDGDPDPGYPASTCIDGWEQYLDDAAFLARIHDFSPLPGTQSLTSFA